jgi:hypothetical protein
LRHAAYYSFELNRRGALLWELNRRSGWVQRVFDTRWLTNEAHDSSAVLTAASIVPLEAIERVAMLLDAAGLRSRRPHRACSRRAKIPN